ncbi:hypothetical protein KPL40_00970 [Clostridium gasigenes]|uniref:hypothetical protein n=1 Tax=Clostridium gasigenes TaxID=94869 RepID=UPI001C0E2B8E|nr:hypothetical protein [Clostridium gasigenes]MBU3131010.1 hypothetical protein [Clostridium gasigenes]
MRYLKYVILLLTLYFTWKTATIFALAVGLFFTVIVASKITGISKFLPEKITAESKINIDDIKGYMTIKEVSIRTKIELNELYKELDIPNSVPEDTKLKDVKNFVDGFEVEIAKEKLK